MSEEKLTLTPEAARAAAKTLARAYQEGRLLQGLPADCCPTTLTDGYFIQDMLVKELELQPAGWKVGLTDLRVQKARGYREPIRAQMFRQRMLQSPARLPAAPGRLLLEAEFLFQMREQAGIGSRQSILECVSAAHIGMEFCTSRFAPSAAVTVPMNLADNSVHGGLVIGPPIAGWQSVNLPSVVVELRCDGVRVASGSGELVLGDPVNALTWLVESLSKQGRSLRAGDWVATGSCIGAPVVAAGVSATASFQGLGDVHASLDTRARWCEFL